MIDFKKYYPRAWIDLTFKEVAFALSSIVGLNGRAEKAALKSFQEEYARFVGTKKAITFFNCRSALYFSLKALDFEKGDEIILPAFSFWVDTAVVVLAGLKPVFVDVDFSTMNIDVKKIEEKISSKTRAIIPTHLNGIVADMEKIMHIADKYGLRVIEDCARSCGANIGKKKAGSYDIGVFSFGYGKSFYSFGGGAVTSSDTIFIEKLLEIKKGFGRQNVIEKLIKILKGSILKILLNNYFYGFYLFPKAYDYQVNEIKKYRNWFKYQTPEYTAPLKEFQVDMCGIQALVGKRQLNRIDRQNRMRNTNARIMSRELKNISQVHIPKYSGEDVMVHYAVYAEDKQALQKSLFDCRIDAQDESAMDVSKFAPFRAFSEGSYPVAEKLDGHVLFLPTHPNLTESDILSIAGCVKRFFNNQN